MSTWIYDANITRDTVNAFEEVGIEGVHLVYDLNYAEDLEDDAVIAIAQKEKKTLVTGDYQDFLNKPNSQIKSTSGIWIFNTKDPDKRKKLFKLALVTSNLKSLKSRKGKKVYIKNDSVDVVDCRTGKKEIKYYNKNNDQTKTNKRKKVKRLVKKRWS